MHSLLIKKYIYVFASSAIHTLLGLAKSFDVNTFFFSGKQTKKDVDMKNGKVYILNT